MAAKVDDVMSVHFLEKTGDCGFGTNQKHRLWSPFREIPSLSLSGRQIRLIWIRHMVKGGIPDCQTSETPRRSPFGELRRLDVQSRARLDCGWEHVHKVTPCPWLLQCGKWYILKDL